MVRNLLYIILVFTICGCHSFQKEITHLPNGYIGAAAVVFDSENGAPEKYINDIRVYDIPQCGVLKTKFKDPGTSFFRLDNLNSDFIFIYVGQNRVADTIPVMPVITDWSPNKKDSFFTKEGNEVYILEYGMTSFTFNGDIRYESVFYFVVDTLKNRGKDHAEVFTKDYFENCY
jgi:hypothetical protein